MNKLNRISIFGIVSFSFVLLLNSAGGSNIYAQMLSNNSQTNQTNFASNQSATTPQQTNQTSGGNQTVNPQQAQQQMKQADQQMKQAQQQKQQAQQQLQKSQTKNATALSEKLLNFTNSAITSLNDKHDKDALQTLSQMQSYLINATGKQVVVIPSTSTSSSSDSSSGSSD